MAFNAKTNWVQNDTVMPEDMNRIEKGIEDSQEKTELLTAEVTLADGDHFPFYDASASAAKKTLWSTIKSALKTYFDGIYGKALTANTTYYVSTTGNDTTGNGTSSAPYRTISKALTMIPKNLNGFIGYISIAAGAYTEEVNVKDFHGGILRFTGAPNTNVGIHALNIQNCQLFDFQTISVTVTNGMTVADNSYCFCGNPLMLTGGENALSCIGGATIRGPQLEVYNSTNIAVYANGGEIYFDTIKGNSNQNTGLAVNRGGHIYYTTNQLTAAVAMSAIGGGRIYSGSQTQIPNY